MSGQPGVDPTTGGAAGERFGAQALQAFRNLEAVQAGGGRLDLVASTTILVADLHDFAARAARLDRVRRRGRGLIVMGSRGGAATFLVGHTRAGVWRPMKSSIRRQASAEASACCWKVRSKNEWGAPP